MEQKKTREKNRISKQTMQTIYRFYKIGLAVWSILVAVLLIAQAWSIFLQGGQEPYTVETIVAHFQDIAVFVWVWVAAVFVGGIGALIWFHEQDKPIFPKRNKEKEKCMISKNKDDGLNSIFKNAKMIFFLRIGLLIFSVVLIIIGIVNGGMADVYEKAKNICTQCIGLG